MGTLASAIATLENTNPIYNNPGAISGTGDTGSSFGSGIGIYSTLDAGKEALSNQLANVYSGNDPLYPGGSSMTLEQFGQAYEGNPLSTYGDSLANILGVSPSTQLSQIPSGISGSTPTFSNGNLVVGNQTLTPQQATSSYLSGNPTTGWIANIEKWITSHTEDVVVVIVGIILVASGVFAFKQTQTVINLGAKVGKKIAEVSA